MAFRDVKTPKMWREELDRDASGKRGAFRILSRELFNSPAFAALGGSATIVVLAILNKLEYEKTRKKDRKGIPTGQGKLRNNGQFSLTVNELVARGLSESTATRARKRAWELGFFDVIEQGTVHHAGVYRYSERWKAYPNGNYVPDGQQAPGRNVYPDSGFKKKQMNSGVLSDEPGKVIAFKAPSESDTEFRPCQNEV